MKEVFISLITLLTGFSEAFGQWTEVHSPWKFGINTVAGLNHILYAGAPSIFPDPEDSGADFYRSSDYGTTWSPIGDFGGVSEV